MSAPPFGWPQLNYLELAVGEADVGVGQRRQVVVGHGWQQRSVRGWCVFDARADKDESDRQFRQPMAAS